MILFLLFDSDHCSVCRRVYRNALFVFPSRARVSASFRVLATTVVIFFTAMPLIIFAGIRRGVKGVYTRASARATLYYLVASGQP
jgi:hypothetical protein